MKIKICGMTDAQAVEAALSAGVDALGFVFAESPREISPLRARELAQLIPEGIARVAVTRHPSLDLLKEILEVFDPDCLQSDADDFSDLIVRRGPHLIPVFRERLSTPDVFQVGNHDADEGFAPDFVYEGMHSGRGLTVDWSLAAQYTARGRMLLAGGLAADNVGRAIAAVQPWGVDVSSGVESAPGQKDPQRIREFVAAVRAAEQQVNQESPQ